MTEPDIDSAIKALINWFQSQEIMPPDATVIMLKLMAMQLVLKTQDPAKLTKATNNFSHCLLIEIAGHLRHD